MRTVYLAGGPVQQPAVQSALCGIVAPLVRENAGKNRTVVEYALYEASKPIGVATYRIVKRLPKELKGELPTPATNASASRTVCRRGGRRRR